MDKKIIFAGRQARYIDWNKLIPEALDVWRNLKVTKSDDGEIVIEAQDLEEGK